jgi:hypothetical protein
MRLHEQVKHQAGIIEQYREHLDDIRRYLNSSKFDIDTTVQVSDIILRLNELNQSVLLTN